VGGIYEVTESRDHKLSVDKESRNRLRPTLQNIGGNRANGLTEDQVKDSVRSVKTALFEKITVKDLEDSYGKYLDGVAQLLT
jgi:hypothetical protein